MHGGGCLVSLCRVRSCANPNVNSYGARLTRTHDSLPPIALCCFTLCTVHHSIEARHGMGPCLPSCAHTDVLPLRCCAPTASWHFICSPARRSYSMQAIIANHVSCHPHYPHGCPLQSILHPRSHTYIIKGAKGLVARVGSLWREACAQAAA